MTPDTDARSADEFDRRAYADIGCLICLLSSICTWRLLSDYAFPALGHSAKVVQSLVFG